MRNLSLSHTCSQCRKIQIIASGLSASAMSWRKQYEALTSIGWQVLPVKLCRDCACPMEDWRKHKAMEIHFSGTESQLALCCQQTKESLPGNDGAIDRWFRTIHLPA